MAKRDAADRNSRNFANAKPDENWERNWPAAFELPHFPSLGIPEEYNSYPAGLILRFPERDLEAAGDLGETSEQVLDKIRRGVVGQEQDEWGDAGAPPGGGTVPWHKQTLLTGPDLVWAAGEVLMVNLACLVFEAF